MALPRLVSVADVAEALRTTSASIYKMVERGQIPGVVRLGRRVLFDEDALSDWIDQNRQNSCATTTQRIQGATISRRPRTGVRHTL